MSSKLRKLLIEISCIFLMIAFLCTIAFAQNSDIKIVVNGSTISSESPPVSIEGRVLVPVRLVAEALNCKVKWVPNNQTVVIEKGKSFIQIWFGDNLAFTNDGIVKIDAPLKRINGRVMVPLRFVSDNLFAKTTWNSANSTVEIVTDNDEKVVFTERGLENLVRAELEKPTGDITRFDLRSLYDLSIDRSKPVDGQSEISDISLIAECVNLRYLHLMGTEVKDLTPIAKLKNLTDLDLSNTNVLDITPLSNLETLKYVSLFNTKVRDLTPLLNLKKLQFLSISNDVVYKDYEQVRALLILAGFDYDLYELIVEKTSLILSQIISESMTDRDKVKAIHDYIVLNTKYDFDNYLNNKVPTDSYTAHGVLLNGTGVCSGYARATELLLKAVGIENEYVSGEANGYSGWGGHAWNRVKLEGVWYNLDVTWDDPVPDKVGKVRYDYYLIDDETLRRDHRWEVDKK